MRRKNNYLVAVANNGKFRQIFMPGVPRTFDHDCSNWSNLWPFVCGSVCKGNFVGTILMSPQRNTSFCSLDNWWMFFQGTTNNEL